MTISEAIIKLKKIKDNVKDDYVKDMLSCTIEDLTNYKKLFGDGELNEAFSNKIGNISSLDSPPDRSKARDLCSYVLSMCHYKECKRELDNNKRIIDGETAQWWTTAIQGVIGIVSIVFTILFALQIIPNVFGKLGEDDDAFYFIIGTAGQQIVALALAVVIGIINKRRHQKMYENKDFSFEELVAAKYENEPVKRWLLLPYAKKISNSKVVLGDDKSVIFDNRNVKLHDGSQLNQNVDNVINNN